jgi:phage RecT family recombinase
LAGDHGDLSPIAARREMQDYLQHPACMQHLAALLQNKGIEPNAFVAAVATDAMRTPQLSLAIRQAPDSLMDALSVCAASGLLPGSSHGQFYLIPRYASKRARTEVTFITGYKGLCDIAYRHPRVFSVRAVIAFVGEEFEYDPGANTIRHVWNGDVKREGLDDILAVYAAVELATPAGMHAGGRPIYHVMTRKEILAAKARSETGRRDFGPWKADPLPMARKTPLRRLLGGGSVPRQYDLVHLLARESEQDEIVDPAPTSGSRDGPTGLAGLQATLSEREPMPELPPDEARAELSRLTRDLPDALDPAMMSDQDVASAMEFYRTGNEFNPKETA